MAILLLHFSEHHSIIELYSVLANHRSLLADALSERYRNQINTGRRKELAAEQEEVERASTELSLVLEGSDAFTTGGALEIGPAHFVPGLWFVRSEVALEPIHLELPDEVVQTIATCCKRIHTELQRQDRLDAFPECMLELLEQV